MKNESQHINRRSFIETAGTLTAGWVMVPGTFISGFGNTRSDQQYKNKSENYPEYTMIGKPITELFRLESIAENNSINFFNFSPYQKMECSQDGVFKYSRKNIHSYWRKSDSKKVDLKGVKWRFVRNFYCSYKT